MYPRLCLILQVVIFAALYQYAYVEIYAVYFGSEGFGANFSASRCAVALVFSLSTALLILEVRHDAVREILLVNLWLSIIPLFMEYSVRPETFAFFYSIWAGMFVICILQYVPVLQTRIFIPNIGRNQLSRFVIGATVLVIIYMFLQLRSIVLSFNILEYYRIRSDFVDNIDKIGSYISVWLPKIFGPVAIILASQRRWYLVTAGLFLALFLLAISTGTKAFLFYLVFVGILMLLPSPGRFNFYIWAAIVGCFVASPFVNIITGYMGLHPYFFDYMTLRRALAMPAAINWYYYDFGQLFGHMNFAETTSLFGGVNYLNDNSQLAISERYIGYRSFMGSGYVGWSAFNFGPIGVVVVSFLLGILLNVASALSRRIDTKVAIIVLLIPVTTVFHDAALHTSLLTHGLAVSLALLWVLSSCEPSDAASLSRIPGGVRKTT